MFEKDANTVRSLKNLWGKKSKKGLKTCRSPADFKSVEKGLKNAHNKLNPLKEQVKTVHLST
jgi:hypothetical protein